MTVEHVYGSARNDCLAGEGVLVPKKGLNEVAKFLDIDGDKFMIGIKESNFISQKRKRNDYYSHAGRRISKI
jgi:hypothetical protein